MGHFDVDTIDNTVHVLVLSIVQAVLATSLAFGNVGSLVNSMKGDKKKSVLERMTFLEWVCLILTGVLALIGFIWAVAVIPSPRRLDWVNLGDIIFGFIWLVAFGVAKLDVTMKQSVNELTLDIPTAVFLAMKAAIPLFVIIADEDNTDTYSLVGIVLAFLGGTLGVIFRIFYVKSMDSATGITEKRTDLLLVASHLMYSLCTYGNVDQAVGSSLIVAFIPFALSTSLKIHYDSNDVRDKTKARRALFLQLYIISNLTFYSASYAFSAASESEWVTYYTSYTVPLLGEDDKSLSTAKLVLGIPIVVLAFLGWVYEEGLSTSSKGSYGRVPTRNAGNARRFTGGRR